jgi:hypothetical protein
MVKDTKSCRELQRNLRIKGLKQLNCRADLVILMQESQIRVKNKASILREPCDSALHWDSRLAMT